MNTPNTKIQAMQEETEKNDIEIGKSLALDDDEVKFDELLKKGVQLEARLSQAQEDKIEFDKFVAKLKEELWDNVGNDGSFDFSEFEIKMDKLLGEMK